MNFDNLKLRTKALVPLAVMVAVMFAMVAFGALKLAHVSATASEIIERRDLAATHVARATRGISATLQALAGTLIYASGSQAGLASQEEFSKKSASSSERLEEVLRLIPDKAADVSQFKERYAALLGEARKLFEIGRKTPGLESLASFKPDAIKQMVDGVRLLAQLDLQHRALIGDMLTFNQALLAENAKAAADLRAQSGGALVTMIIFALVSTLLAGAFSMWVSSAKIAGPLARLAQRMGALARGDLSIDIEGQQRRDEIGAMCQAVQVFKDNALERVRLESETNSQRAAAEAERGQTAAERARAAEEQADTVRKLGGGLKTLAAGDLTVRLGEEFSAKYAQIRDDFNAAVEALRETIQAVVSSTETIQTGTREIATASDDLSRRTEQQAASLEETAAALDEITATVKKSADGSLHARQVVSMAEDDAKQSSVVVRETVDAMDAISKSAQQISQIIGVIDEIAFQTNLLALNAGVEAARAGEAGRGFAVVASEVRALAQRSAEAAKEIKGLISTSSTQVDRGVKLVAETGKALERIMAQVSEINVVVVEIASGAQAQANGLEEINTAITQMDQVTQQNAAMVEQSTAASQSLSQEIMQLTGLVGRFQVGAGSDLRQQLKKAAPHAFRSPAKAPAPGGGRPAVRAVATGPKVQKVANAAPAAASSSGWDEF